MAVKDADLVVHEQPWPAFSYGVPTGDSDYSLRRRLIDFAVSLTQCRCALASRDRSHPNSISLLQATCMRAKRKSYFKYKYISLTLTRERTRHK